MPVLSSYRNQSIDLERKSIDCFYMRTTLAFLVNITILYPHLKKGFLVLSGGLNWEHLPDKDSGAESVNACMKFFLHNDGLKNDLIKQKVTYHCKFLYSLAELRFSLELIWTLSCLLPLDAEFNLESRVNPKEISAR